MSRTPLKISERPRNAGILLPLFSLPGPFGIGDMGPAARRWAEGLARSGQLYWQILPVGPPAEGNSPYSPQSVFAGDPLLISPESLIQEGLLSEADIRELPSFPAGRVDYPAVASFKDKLLRAAFKNFKEKAPPSAFSEWRGFAARNREWLSDYALFRALKIERQDEPWSRWPVELRTRDFKRWDGDLKRVGEESSYQEFAQFVFDRQWRGFRADLEKLNVRLIGDLPFYPALESADVWSRPGYFSVDGEGRPRSYGGVPPDYFSADGQHWGTPVYAWEALRRDGYAWWRARFERAAELFGSVRLDHFIGFTRYWEIPASAPTAACGAWRKGPGEDFFKTAAGGIQGLELIAENLGVVTPQVEALRRKLGLPGMRVLILSLSARRPRLPRIPWNELVMTGTHDTPTLMEWLEGFPGREALRRAFLGGEPAVGDLRAVLLREVYKTGARTAVVPLQDLLGLGGEARVNRPAAKGDNWAWRVSSEGLMAEALDRAGRLSRESGRFESAAFSA